MKQNKIPQSGRSMVEMLGTLAIIGVLSIGGIAGYSYGMDKYRANQTINDMMLMGVDIITQTSRGAVPTLSEWGTKTTAGYDFSVKPNPTDATKYGIVVDGLPSRVCQMVGDALKTQATVYVSNVDYTANEDACSSTDSNTMEFYFEPLEKTLTCEPECPSGEFCRWGECVSEQIEISKWPTDISCSTNADCEPCGWCGWDAGSQICWPNNGQDCTINTPNDGMCHWGECLPKGCNNKNPCAGQGEYCASAGESNTEAFPNNTTGVCVKADFKPLPVDGVEYWVSNTTINYWDATAACKILGKQLLSVRDFVTDWNNTSGFSTPNSLSQKICILLSDSAQTWTSNDDYVINLCGGEVWGKAKGDTGVFAICK